MCGNCQRSHNWLGSESDPRSLASPTALSTTPATPLPGPQLLLSREHSLQLPGVHTKGREERIMCWAWNLCNLTFACIISCVQCLYRVAPKVCSSFFYSIVQKHRNKLLGQLKSFFDEKNALKSCKVSYRG